MMRRPVPTQQQSEPQAAPPTRIPISGCVITFNEHDRIADCLRSMAFCDEIVVVDSGSTDGTDRIARELGARVVANAPFPGHKEQKQFAVEQARHDWVFCLDADERASPELVARVRDLAARGALAGAGYEFPRQNYFLGKILRHGLHVPDRKLRLFDRRNARWGGTNPHDHVETLRGATTRLPEPIVHLSYRDWAHVRRTTDSFTRIAAEALHAEGRRARWHDFVVRPAAVFVKGYVLKLGFLDGWHGIVAACYGAHYSWRKYCRLREVEARARAARSRP